MIYYKNDVKRKILLGAKKVYDATKNTLGPKNSTSIIYKNDEILIVDDGYTIANSITLDDKIENIGAKILIESASQMKYDIGDGTTSTIIIAYNLLKSIFKKRRLKYYNLFNDIENIKNKLFLELDKNTKKVDNINVLSKVFSLAVNDKILSENIKKALEMVGPNGAIDIIENNYDETEIEVVEGYYYYHGYYDESIFEYKNQVQVEEPIIVIINEENSIEKIIDSLLDKNIILIIDKISIDLKKQIIVNNIRKKTKIFVIKLDENKQIIGQIKKLSEYNDIEYGKCKKVVITKELTRFYFCDEIIEKYLNELNDVDENNKNKTNIYNIERLALNLIKGSAIIKVGAKSELELKLKKYKALDGVKAIEAAKKNGVILGGGRGLLLACKKIKIDNKTEKTFLQSILKPLTFLVKNTGTKLKKEIYKNEDNISYDFILEKWDNELYEPVIIIKKSIEIAISIVRTLAKIDSIIIKKDEKIDCFNNEMF